MRAERVRGGLGWVRRKCEGGGEEGNWGWRVRKDGEEGQGGGREMS